MSSPSQQISEGQVGATEPIVEPNTEVVQSALLIGGVIAAPIAAYVVRLLPACILGTAVAGIILITNMQTFLETVGVTGTPATVICLLIAAVSVSALAWAILVTRHEEQPQVVREGEAAAAEWALTRIDAAGDARTGVPRLRTADRSGTCLIARRRSSRGTPPSRCC